MARLDTQDFVAQVFRLAHRSNVETEVLVFACADLLAATAATLDLSGDAAPLDLRLDTFIAHVRKRYPQIRSEMERARLDRGRELLR